MHYTVHMKSTLYIIHYHKYWERGGGIWHLGDSESLDMCDSSSDFDKIQKKCRRKKIFCVSPDVLCVTCPLSPMATATATILPPDKLSCCKLGWPAKTGIFVLGNVPAYLPKDTIQFYNLKIVSARSLTKSLQSMRFQVPGQSPLPLSPGYCTMHLSPPRTDTTAWQHDVHLPQTHFQLGSNLPPPEEVRPAEMKLSSRRRNVFSINTLK